MSKVYTCIVVDDEPPAIRIVENYIKQIPNLKLIFSTTKPLEAIAFMEKEDFDIAILDIQMPNITGIQLSKIIKSNVKVIFTTAYSEFAVESYNLKALDYLLKPFEFERFYSAIKKIDSKKHNNLPKENNYVFVKKDSKNNFEKIATDAILFIEGLKNYVAIHTISGEQIITYNTLKSIISSLPKDEFIQIHKSYIISISKIETTTTNVVILNRNIELPIGNAYKTLFFEKITENRL